MIILQHVLCLPSHSRNAVHALGTACAVLSSSRQATDLQQSIPRAKSFWHTQKNYLGGKISATFRARSWLEARIKTLFAPRAKCTSERSLMHLALKVEGLIGVGSPPCS